MPFHVFSTLKRKCPVLCRHVCVCREAQTLLPAFGSFILGGLFYFLHYPSFSHLHGALWKSFPRHLFRDLEIAWGGLHSVVWWWEEGWKEERRGGRGRLALGSKQWCAVREEEEERSLVPIIILLFSSLSLCIHLQLHAELPLSPAAQLPTYTPSIL